MPREVTGCLFCGGDPRDPDHRAHCDGRLGVVEAFAFDGRAFEALPLLVSGVSPETWATSEAAAVSVLETKDTQRARVFAAIVRAGRAGRTDAELQAELGLSGNSERPRRRELQMLHCIVEARDAHGQAIRRCTATTRRAVVWIDRRLANAVAS